MLGAPQLLIRALALAAVLLVGAAGGASAALLEAIAPQTEDGQDFDFEFDGVLLSNGTAGVLTIQARGDYQPGNPFEFLTWDIDALGIGTVGGPVTGGATILQDNGPNDVEWVQRWEILGSDLVTATGDGTVNIMVDLNLDALFRGVNHYADTEYVAVSLAYAPVPEPTSALLMLLGGTIVRRGIARRRRH